MTPRFLFAAALALLFAVSPAQGVTLAKAFESALSKVENIPIQQARLGQAEERVRQAWGSLLPNINFLTSYSKQDPSGASSGVSGAFRLTDQWNVRFGATQPLFRGFAEYAGIRSARADREARRADMEQARLTLYSSVAESYYGVLSSDQDRKNLQTLLDLTQQRVKDLKSRSRIGRSREGEVLSAQAQVAVFEAQLRAAVSAAVQARDRFALATGLERDAPLELPGKVTSVSTKQLNDYVKKIDERPDIVALKERLAMSDHGVVIARAGHFPSLDLTGNYYLKRTGVQDGIKWDVGVLLTVPLFAGGGVDARVGQALDLRKESELLLAQGRRTAETAIRNAFESVRSGAEQFEALSEAADLAERNYRQQVKDYRLGLVTNLDVLQAMNTFQETKRSLDRVRYQTFTAWAALHAAVGKLP